MLRNTVPGYFLKTSYQMGPHYRTKQLDLDDQKSALSLLV